MIPNYLIREILVAEGFKLHDVNGEQDLKPYVYNGFRKCLAEALKVNPLRWHENPLAWTAAGLHFDYRIVACGFSFSIYTDMRYGESMLFATNVEGLESAKELAQRDNDMNVLRNLIYGGVES